MSDLARVLDVFRSFDTKGKGVISRRLLAQVLLQLGDKEDEVESLLDTYNCDEVNYEDFVKWVMGYDKTNVFRHAQAEDVREQIVQVFRSYDPDGAGTIPREQLARVLEHLGDDALSVDRLLGPGSPSMTGPDVNYEEFVDWILSSEMTYGLSSPTRWGEGQFYFARPRCQLPHADRRIEPGPEPVPRAATLAEFREQHAGNRRLLDKLVNKVLVCTQCRKACAITLDSCNGCGTSLKGIQVSHNDNIFMGFVFGIAKGNFPYQVSIRNQSRELLCFDDPLSMSVCHFCVIPTTVYIPDWRFLFADPARGLELIERLADFGATAAREQFWSNDAFRQRYWAAEAPPTTNADLLELSLNGLNFPPSMYQLHLQFIHAPLFPFHYAQACHKGHYHHGRFFPLEYVRAALKLGEAVRMNVTESTPMADIMGRVESLGVHYDAFHAAFLERSRRLQARFSPWMEDDFEFRVENGKVISVETGGEIAGLDAKQIQAEDDKILRNYGRPYDGSGRPTLSFYKFSKAPEDVKDWPVH